MQERKLITTWEPTDFGSDFNSTALCMLMIDVAEENLYMRDGCGCTSLVVKELFSWSAVMKSSECVVVRLSHYTGW